MPRMYTVTFTSQTLATASGDIDLWELTPADDKPIEIVGMSLAVTSELGDAADEWAAIQIIRGFTASGSGGGTPTPGVLDGISTAAGFTVEDRNTTVATTGTGVTLWAGGWNVRAGYDIWFPDGCGPMASQANTTIVVRQSTTWTDDVTASGTLFVREMP
jgi:hypothetical protein